MLNSSFPTLGYNKNMVICTVKLKWNLEKEEKKGKQAGIKSLF